MPIKPKRASDEVVEQTPVTLTRRNLTLADVITAGQQFDLLFAAPTQPVIAMLDEFYVDGPGTLDRCLRVHELMAANSVAAIYTRIRHLPVIATELLPRCGFAGVYRLPVVGPADLGNLSNVRVLVIARRGEPETVLPSGEVLRRARSSAEAMRIAESIMPGARRRLHIFAEADTEGWTSVIGDNTWIEAPTLR